MQSWQTALRSFLASSQPTAIAPTAACRLVSSTHSDMPPPLRLALFALLQRQQKLLVPDAHAAPTIRSFAAALRAADATSSSFSPRQKQQQNQQQALAAVDASEWLPKTLWSASPKSRPAAGVTTQVLAPSAIKICRESADANSTKKSNISSAETEVVFSPPPLLVAEVWSRAMSDSVVDSISKVLIPRVFEFLAERTRQEQQQQAENNKEQKQEEVFDIDEDVATMPSAQPSEGQQGPQLKLSDLAPALSSAGHLYAALYSSREHLLFAPELVRSCDRTAHQLLDALEAVVDESAACAVAFCDLTCSFAGSLRMRGNETGKHRAMASRLLRASRLMCIDHNGNTTSRHALWSRVIGGGSTAAPLSAAAAAPSRSALVALPIRVAGEWVASRAANNRSGGGDAALSALQYAPQLAVRLLARGVETAKHDQRTWVSQSRAHFEERLAEIGAEMERELEQQRLQLEETKQLAEGDDDYYEQLRNQRSGVGDKHDAKQQQQQKQTMERHLKHVVARDHQIARSMMNEIVRETRRSAALVARALAPPRRKEVLALLPQDDDGGDDGGGKRSQSLKATLQLDGGGSSSPTHFKCLVAFSKKALLQHAAAPLHTPPSSSQLFFRWLMSSCWETLLRAVDDKSSSSSSGNNSNKKKRLGIDWHSPTLFPMSAVVPASLSRSAAAAAAAVFHFPDGSGWCRVVPSAQCPLVVSPASRGNFALVLEVSGSSSSSAPASSSSQTTMMVEDAGRTLVFAHFGLEAQLCVATEVVGCDENSWFVPNEVERQMMR